MTGPGPGVLLERLARAVAARYRIEKEVGRGSMARVYQAREVGTDRVVAVKLLPPEMATEANAERFHREIRFAGTLDHPNILRLIDSGSGDGLHWYVMPLVQGDTIRDLVKLRGLLPIPETVEIVTQVGSALSYAHGKGIVHRDLKPENIMVAEGRAMVVDFGLGRAVDGQSNLTGMGMPLGTPAYMSPEQILGAATVDGRADIYSLGCVVYEMVTGRPPFVGSTVIQLLQGHLTGTPDPPSWHRQDLPQAIDAALLKALAKEPAARYASPDLFVAELAGPGGPGPTPSRPSGLLRRLFGGR